MSEMIRKPDMVTEKYPQELLSADVRKSNFEEVEQGYDAATAVKEAGRCMNCPAKYCERECPLHTPVPEVMHLLREGKEQEAYEAIRSKNPIPGITSRVCPQEKQCESDCTRTIKGEAVGIGRVERYLSDNYKLTVNAAPKSDKKVAVVGSGPAGIACAMKLANAGVQVTILEAADVAGGVPATEIPSFVLPKEKVSDVLAELEELGVEIKTGVKVEKPTSLLGEYQAVFLGIGAGAPVELKAEGAENCLQADEYLTAAERKNGKNVVIIGGGDTAIDCARVAVRDGAEKVTIAYRRSVEQMPARKYELELAKEEGIVVKELVSPVRFDAVSGGLTCEFSVMELVAADYPGGRLNVAATEVIEAVEADLVVLALGFKNVAFTDIETDAQGRIVTAKNSAKTSVDGIYAGGDAVVGASTVAIAAAAGSKAADEILAAL